MTTSQTPYVISTDRTKLDIKLIHASIGSSYWARSIPLEILRKSITNSLCFGVFDGKEQVGFARVVSDYSTFAYIADVFVVESHRGRGLSKMLMKEIMDHPQLQNLRRWMLATKDAHGLYKQFGFVPVAKPETLMEIVQINPYENN